jgi:hypothetical protein
LFPISFAAVVGRGSVKFATWNLEQGTTLGALEQLMGSRTVASAFTTQLQLRSFNWIGLVLLFIWCLSPIGGQSVLHLPSTPIKSTMTLNNITYINSRQQSYAAPGGSFKGQWYPGFAILFGSSLLAPNSIVSHCRSSRFTFPFKIGGPPGTNCEGFSGSTSSHFHRKVADSGL